MVLTHSGINVGEDGKTHHCIDFLGLARNLPGFRVIIPADPNQTDRVIRFISKEDNNFLIVTGRTKNPIITNSSDQPMFASGYEFAYGKIDIVREGDKGVVMTFGRTLTIAIKVWEQLLNEGIRIAIWNVSSPLALTKEDVEKAIFTGPVFTFEDHLVYSGLGTIVGNLIAESGMGTIFHKIGVTDFAPSGSTQELYCAMGLDSVSVKRSIKKIIQG